MNTQKQQVYERFTYCLVAFFGAILTAHRGQLFYSVLCTTLGMYCLILFLDVWLEPEKWKQKQ